MSSELKGKQTPGPWFVRHCDDSSFMNMTVISSKDYGDRHSGLFEDEPDTIAIVFHQMRPCVSCEMEDLGDANAALMAEAGTVANATGLWPRELAEQRKELLGTLRNLVEFRGAMHGTADIHGDIAALNQLYAEARAAVAKAETRQSVVDELKALGVSEPTEEERFLRREEDQTRRWLRKTDIEAEGGTE